MNPFEHNAVEALIQLLKLTDIKITKKTLTDKLQQHPNFPSLASIKDVLTEFKIKTVAARGTIDKLSVMPMPSLVFLTIEGGFFAPVRKVSDGQVEWYHTQKGWQNNTLYEFEQKWSGAILLIEPTTDSNERNYTRKYFQQWIKHALLPFIVTAILTFILLLIGSKYPAISGVKIWQASFLLLIKLTGAVLSGLLIWRSLKPSKPVIRPVSYLLYPKRKNNSLSNSRGAYLFSWLSWAELGTFYFTGGALGFLIAIIFNENIDSLLFFLSLLPLPFTIYLFYYQVFRAKEWCLMCLTVLVLFWIEFFISYHFTEGFSASSSIQGYWFLGSYLFIISIYAVIKPFLLSQNEEQDLRRELKRMKFNPDYMEGILKAESQLPPVFENMKIIGIGDPAAQHTLTFVYSPSNPESATIHNEVHKLFRNQSNQYWQIIFLPLNETDIQVIQTILNLSEETALKGLDDWFLNIEQPVEKWKQSLGNGLGLSDDEIKEQISFHANWCNLARITSIPGIFINGVLIPVVYQTYDFPFLLNYLSKINQQRQNNSLRLSQSMKIITCITNQEEIGYKHALKASCNFFNLELITLTHPGKWDSHRHKDNYLKQYLLSLPGNEVVLFTDGYDTILLGGEKEIMERYRRIAPEGGIVISAEKTCYPDPSLASTYPTSATPYRFLNSGGIIGTAADILGALETMEEMKATMPEDPFLYSNQYLWTRMMLEKGNTGIRLDINCDLFQTFPTTIETVRKFQSVSEIEEKKEIVMTEMTKILRDFQVNDGCNIYNKITGTYPLHLHFNGPVMKPAMLVQPFLSFINKVNQPISTQERTSVDRVAVKE